MKRVGLNIFLTDELEIYGYMPKVSPGVFIPETQLIFGQSMDSLIDLPAIPALSGLRVHQNSFSRRRAEEMTPKPPWIIMFIEGLVVFLAVQGIRWFL